MRDSYPLNRTLRRSLLPFITAGIILSMVIMASFELLTVYQTQLGRQKEHSVVLASTVSRFFATADSSLVYLSKGIASQRPDDIRRFGELFKLFNRIVQVDREGCITADSGADEHYASIGAMVDNALPAPPLTALYSAPFISPLTGSPSVNAVIPLPDGGFLIGELNLAVLQERVMSTLRLTGSGRTIFITDSYGNLIVHPDADLPARQTNWGHLPLIRETVRSGETVDGIFSIDGERFLAIGRLIPGIGWVLVDSAAFDNIAAGAVKPVLIMMGLFLLLFLTMLLIIGATMNRNIVYPLTYMFHILERSVIEDVPQKIELSSHGFTELDTIQNAFNTLSEKVRNNTEKLSRFEKAVNEAGYAIYMTDTEGTILFVNPAFERITGFSAREATGKRSSILSSGEMPDDYYARLWETILKGEMWEEEIINRKKDGTLYYASQTVAPISGENGTVTGFVAIQSDITQQKESQRRLRESETMYRNLFENAADSIFLIDSRTFRIIECNQAAHTLLDYGRDELKQLSYIDIQHPDHRERTREQLKELDASHQVTVDSRHLTRYGEVRSVIANLTCLEMGARPLILAMVHDVTQRKEAEEAIRQSERKYRLLAENSTDMISRHENDGTYVYASPACERLLGYTQDELAGINAFDLFHPDDLEAIRHSSEQILEGEAGTIASVTYRIRRKDGGYIWFETLSRAVDGGIIAISRDVSERVAMEQALESAKEAAEEANRAKSIFLANMSHEIRTPMNAVLGFNELLARHINEPRLKQYTEQVERSGRILLNLIGDILDFSRIEAGKLSIAHAPFSPRKLAMDIVSMFGVEAEKKGLDLRLIIEEQVPPSIVLDEDRVRQILINLAGNAIKFTETGSLSLIVRADYHPVVPGRCSISFSIEDTGIGIPEQEQERIFEAFSQMEGQSTRKYGGTGLGLAISRSLAEAMGGDIRLRSRPGEGSVFTLVFPEAAWIASEERDAAEEPGPRGAAEETEAGTGAKPSAVPAGSASEELRREWEEVRSSMVLDDIAAFAGRLEREARENGDEKAALFARSLLNAADMIDIDGLNQLLGSDPFSSGT